MIKTINIYTTPYYDSISNNYYHIIILNNKPVGPLKNYIKIIHIKNGSSRISRINESYCGYGISKDIVSSDSLNSNRLKINICTIDDISEIYDFLINNNYILNSDLTELYNKNTHMITNDSKRLIYSFSYIKDNIN
tara:strand:+ start:426 stop:833 length:408 start_codon:yes stop_codon:yes gene_type:complete